jgi:hypothetical protein
MSDDESFFREVDEDYRRDQFVKFLRRDGAYLIGAAFVIVAVVGGYSIEKRRSYEQAAHGGDSLTNALSLAEAGKQEEAQKALAEIAASGPAAYKVLARLNLAADAVAKKQRDAAVSQYRAVADDASAPSDLRDFARMQIAALQVDNESYDKLSAELQPFRAGTSPWRFTATEILGFSAFKEGKKTEAERLFGEIVSDGGAPQGMRQTAEVMLALLLERPKADAAQPAVKKDTANDAKTQ